MDGDTLDTAVVHTEGDEHCTPVTVGIAVPLAISGIALLYTGLCDHVVQVAFFITQLGLGDLQNVLLPDTSEFYLSEGAFPIGSLFQMGCGIGVTSRLVGMFLYLACQLPNAVAQLGMGMYGRFFHCTGQGLLCLLEASVAVSMVLCLNLAANKLHRAGGVGSVIIGRLDFLRNFTGKFCHNSVTALPVGMTGRFLHSTLQDLLVASIAMDMLGIGLCTQEGLSYSETAAFVAVSLCLGNRTGQFPYRRGIATVVMGVRLSLSNGLRKTVALIRMDMGRSLL